MRWALLVFGGVAALAVIVFTFVPAAGGPSPGPVFSKPTVEECRQRAKSPTAIGPDREQTLEEVTVKWVWSSDVYGWGCHYRFTGGSTRVIVE